MSAEEFLQFCQLDSAISSRGLSLFNVSAEQFVNWRWQMKHQLQTPEDFPKALSLSVEENEGFASLQKLFRAGLTPYYAALMKEDASCPIRLQALPRSEEFTDFLGKADPLEERLHSPVAEVVHLYPDRVAFCVAMLCPVYCRYCYRKRRDEETGLHFNRAIITRGLDYIRSNPAIRDVLVTGGDPFISSDESIEHLVKSLREIPHVEIIRFGTRTPVTLPYRVTKTLCKILSKYHPIWVNTHFNCVEEITAEAIQALNNLVDAGIPVGNQSVLLRGINDSVEKMMDLCRTLVRHRVRPYYLFHPHLVEGTEHLRPSVSKGLAIVKGLRGKLSGFAIPTYIVDTPSGKVPIQHNYILGQDGQDLLLETPRGDIWREKGAWN
jgi:lysine 2,3-aminomutase